jgi:hypothetical protein
MRATTPKELATAMSRQLANYNLSDDVIKSLAERVTIEGLFIGRFNPCIYGICIDYFTDKIPNLAGITIKQKAAKWEVFPYGIIDWDRFHIKVAYNVDELAGKVGGITAGGGFGH